MKRCFGSPDREWLHPERFCNEPIYCEALHNPDDILCPGSDDEAYNSPGERRLRYEYQAQRFLEGKPVFLLSASLRGPFDRKSGWVNPWRSKSASLAKSAQRKRPPAPKRATAGQNESIRISDSSTRHLRTRESKAALPRGIDTSPMYMDAEAFNRVWEWRARILAESDDPTPIQDSSPTEPSPADSRLATQHTARRESAASTAANDVGNGATPGSPTPKGKQTPSYFRGSAGQLVSSSQVAARKERLEPSTIPTTPDLLPADTSGTSQRSARAPEPSDQRGRTTRDSPAEQTAEETATRRAAERPLPTKPVDGKKSKRASVNTTTRGVRLEEIATSARLEMQPSCRSDGSFRYRHKNLRSVAGSKSSGSTLGSKDAAEHPDSGGRFPSGPPLADKERNLEPGSESKTPNAAMVSSAEAVPQHVSVPTGVEVPGMLEDVPQPEPPEDATQLEPPKDTPQLQPPEDAPQAGHDQSAEERDGQAAEQDQFDEEDSAGTTLQIDGPTLVASGSSSGSEHPSTLSIGHLSAEKHSQDIISEYAGFPRKLLWPRASRRSGTGDALPTLGYAPRHMPESEGPEPSSLDSCRSTAQKYQHHAKETVSQAAAETAAVRTSPEEQTRLQKDQAGVVSQAIVERAEVMVERAAESETQSEGEDGNVQEAEQPQDEACAGSAVCGEVETETQSGTPLPGQQIQSPWANDDAPLLPSRVPDTKSPGPSENVPVSDTRSSQPRGVQSPWMMEAEIPPRASDEPEQLPPPLGPAKLPFIASQALEQATSQSPWARGDSQIPLPDVRLLNPLCSPTNSNGLPAVDDAVPQYQQATRDGDIDMCNSQLYPNHPSTPQTKQSGLPTPDFTLSVKSFKEFMTPSPQPAAKRRRISPTGDHLTSTQALVDAALSNPWARASSRKSEPRQQKRVSWAPLPGEEGDLTTPASGAESEPLPDTGPHHHHHHHNHRSRPASPPPSILATAKLPAANEKFAKHFAAVANRRRGLSRGSQTPRMQKKKTNVLPLLPSASQQVCGSPAVDAMAEAFIRADEQAAVVVHHSERVESSASREEKGMQLRLAMEPEPGMGMEMGMDVDVDVDGLGGERGVEHDVAGDAHEERERDEEVEVDDVSAVMQNLDDFLGSAWDLDAELARARAERKREGRSRGGVVTAAGSPAALSGLMDLGVWD
ncbi:hypothetical protein VTK56DRAFT_7991 [Thermocarpiscus australiensis]